LQLTVQIYPNNNGKYHAIDDEDVHDDDAEYLEYLASQAAAHANDAEGDDFDDDVQEEVLFESPLDEIDPYIRFSDSFRGKFINPWFSINAWFDFTVLTNFSRSSATQPHILFPID
jgi:hypothetical protein